MTALIVFVVLDYVIGVICAIIDKKLSSEIGFRGIFKKVLIFLLVGVANIVDVHVIGTRAAIHVTVICFYLSNEGVSILENAAHIGLPVPEKLKAVLDIVISSQPRFVGKDVAEILGYANPQKTIRDHVYDDDKMVNESFTVNGMMAVLINEGRL